MWCMSNHNWNTFRKVIRAQFGTKNVTGNVVVDIDFVVNSMKAISLKMNKRHSVNETASAVETSVGKYGATIYHSLTLEAWWGISHIWYGRSFSEFCPSDRSLPTVAEISWHISSLHTKPYTHILNEIHWLLISIRTWYKFTSIRCMIYSSLLVHIKIWFTECNTLSIPVYMETVIALHRLWGRFQTYQGSILLNRHLKMSLLYVYLHIVVSPLWPCRNYQIVADTI